MEAKEVQGQDLLVDLENGDCLLTRENSSGDADSVARQEITVLNGSWNDLLSLKDEGNQHMVCCSSHSRDSIVKHGDRAVSEGAMREGILDSSVGDKEKKKRSKKPPRPPRPPVTSPLDPADQKLISELSELAVLKRARIERMKALKKMKNPKSESSTGSLVALIITVIFCFFILWQGVFSRQGASIIFHGRLISSDRKHGGLISIQFYNKNATDISPQSSSVAPNNMGAVTSLDIHGEARSVSE